eukprot:CAMPEP_0114265816 /NCGR_PEP_ID=MMETSP0058-20121206/24185_1 /TAXON_ID=36894 /ORGANISM="Pyramimonas parkeae, CCMP726" /LENGTH=295 /DNA_ID=CAMNT_0001383069 /DNA_START=204 /DNA_END=1088 /DNA_ORIENTATION=+
MLEPYRRYDFVSVFLYLVSCDSVNARMLGPSSSSFTTLGDNQVNHSNCEAVWCARAEATTPVEQVSLNRRLTQVQEEDARSNEESQGTEPAAGDKPGARADPNDEGNTVHRLETADWAQPPQGTEIDAVGDRDEEVGRDAPAEEPAPQVEEIDSGQEQPQLPDQTREASTSPGASDVEMEPHAVEVSINVSPEPAQHDGFAPNESEESPEHLGHKDAANSEESELPFRDHMSGDFGTPAEPTDKSDEDARNAPEENEETSTVEPTQEAATYPSEHAEEAPSSVTEQEQEGEALEQ